MSIHSNAISLARPEVNGIETYYYTNRSRRLAEVLHENLLASTAGATDRGVRTARFYVIRNTSMPSVLLELGFVTGNFDAERLADPEHRTEIAHAIVRGLLEYIREQG